MSKSKGNLIAPTRYFDTVGADGLRLFHLFVGPPGDDMDWTEQTDQVIDGCGRFLDRLWRLVLTDEPLRAGTGQRAAELAAAQLTEGDWEVRRATHRTIESVGRDFERWSYNTAVAHCMELVNLLQRYVRHQDRPHGAVLDEAFDSLLTLLAPMCPHVTAELWERRHGPDSAVHAQRWPAFFPELTAQATVTMVVQVNGKVKDRIEVPATVTEDEAQALALASAAVAALVAEAGGPPERVIVRPPRLVNVMLAAPAGR
jgi:leucyl-tRNA synthetase